MEVNDYKIFENHDEAVYAAKSKEDVYNYFVNMYGSTEECQNKTKEQFIDELSEIDINGKVAQRKRLYVSDDDGYEWESSYYDEYKKVALRNIGADVIAYLVW